MNRSNLTWYPTEGARVRPEKLWREIFGPRKPHPLEKKEEEDDRLHESTTSKPQSR